MFKLEKIKFTTYLGLISIAGFVAIFLNALAKIDIGGYVDSMLFLLIGLSLFISGGYKLIFSYFKGGLTPAEISKIVSVVVGVASMFVGLLTVPFLGIEAEVFSGIKIIISGIAILVIGIELIYPNN